MRFAVGRSPECLLSPLAPLSEGVRRDEMRVRVPTHGVRRSPKRTTSACSVIRQTFSMGIIPFQCHCTLRQMTLGLRHSDPISEVSVLILSSFS